MTTDAKSRFSHAWRAGGEDNISILAAGVAYYAFLALVPLLAAAVLIYGLVADPETVARHIEALAGMLPESASDLIGEQLSSTVETSSGSKGLGLLLALALALFGARNGASSVVTAITMAYDQPSRRSFLRSNLLALVITLGALVGAGLVVVILGLTAALEDILPGLRGAGALLVKALSYLVLLAAGVGGSAILYRQAPEGKKVEWRAVLPGALLAGIGWVVFTLAFGIYVANFGNYNATYGSLGAVIILLTWLYLAAYVLLFGAELNAAGFDRKT